MARGEFIDYLERSKHPNLQTVVELGVNIPSKGYRFHEPEAGMFKRYGALKQQLIIAIAQSAIVDQVQWSTICREVRGPRAADELYDARELLSDVVQYEGFQTEQGSSGLQFGMTRVYGFRVFWGVNAKEAYQFAKEQGPAQFDYPIPGTAPAMSI